MLELLLFLSFSLTFVTSTHSVFRQNYGAQQQNYAAQQRVTIPPISLRNEATKSTNNLATSLIGHCHAKGYCLQRTDLRIVVDFCNNVEKGDFTTQGQEEFFSALGAFYIVNYNPDRVSLYLLRDPKIGQFGNFGGQEIMSLQTHLGIPNLKLKQLLEVSKKLGLYNVLDLFKDKMLLVNLGGDWVMSDLLYSDQHAIRREAVYIAYCVKSKKIHEFTHGNGWYRNCIDPERIIRVNNMCNKKNDNLQDYLQDYLINLDDVFIIAGAIYKYKVYQVNEFNDLLETLDDLKRGSYNQTSIEFSEHWVAANNNQQGKTVKVSYFCIMHVLKSLNLQKYADMLEGAIDYRHAISI